MDPSTRTLRVSVGMTRMSGSHFRNESQAYERAAGSLVLHALSNKQATPEEILAIREMLDEIEGGIE